MIKLKPMEVFRLPKKMSAATLFMFSSVNSIKDSWIGDCLTHQMQHMQMGTNNR